MPELTPRTSINSSDLSATYSVSATPQSMLPAKSDISITNSLELIKVPLKWGRHVSKESTSD